MAFKLNNESTEYQGKNLLFLTLTIFLGFTIFGLSENVKGPAIPFMQADFEMSEWVLGLILALNAFGYLIACTYTAALAKRIGLKACVLICLGIMAVSGVAICFASSIVTLAIAFFILYLGNGMIEISLGIMAAVIFTKNPGKMINLAHFFYGLGSIIGPVLAVQLMTARLGEVSFGWRIMYLISMALALVPFVIGLFGKINARASDSQRVDYRGYLKDPSAWFVIIILAFGSIGEVGMGSWLVNYLEKANGYPNETAALFLTGFFLLYTLARLVLGSFTDRIGLLRSILITSLFATICIVVGVALGAPGAFLLALSGLGLALTYPTILAVVARHFAAVVDTAMTVTMTLMGIFLMLAQLLMGILIDVSRVALTPLYGEAGLGMAYSVGILFLALCSLGAFVFTLLLRRRLGSEC